MRTSYDQSDVQRLIDQLVSRIASSFKSDFPLNIIGIRTRGETLAARLSSALRERGFGQIGRGVLDITLYRDDLSEIGPKPMVRPTKIDAKLDSVPLLLVDDVLFTGRSIRAAMDALSDFGRPSAIRLAVLVDRNGRELPIHADVVGKKMDVPAGARVDVLVGDLDGEDSVVLVPREDA